MTWYYRLLFAIAAIGAARGFAKAEVYYPFSAGEREMRMPPWLARAVMGLLVIFFAWIALLK